MLYDCSRSIIETKKEQPRHLPVGALPDWHIAGLEVLLRRNDPEIGAVSPGTPSPSWRRPA